ncbi:MAG: DNA polymerase III subunit chi [Gammaproteobacteria bacterium]|nr:DNA polymerase III subunit chi [Gammaproteobacteria bacterium]
MTRVDFYVLQPDATGDRFVLACRIAEKARRAGSRVLIHSTVDEECRHLDRLLWTLWDDSFIPHGMLGRDDRALNPILIGDGSADTEEHEVMINLSPEVPRFFSRYDRLIECVDHDEGVKQAGRERFRYYREHGYPMNTFDVG